MSSLTLSGASATPITSSRGSGRRRIANATVCGRSPLPGEFPHFGIAPLLPQLALGQGVADRRVVYDGFVHRVVGIPDRHRPGEGQFPGSEFRPTRNSSSEICANIEKVVKKNS